MPESKMPANEVEAVEPAVCHLRSASQLMNEVEAVEPAVCHLPTACEQG
jgi:hypothetical protein